MGVTRRDLFSQKLNEMSAIAKCIGHPARLAILEHIIKSPSCINSDLVQELGLAQATISQHLRELKEVGLIKGSIEGASMCYCIDGDRWRMAKSVFEEFFKALPENKDHTECC